MKTAEKLLEKKKWIKAEIERREPQLAETVWKESKERLSDILVKYKDIPEGEHSHTDGYIFPSAAIYLTLKKYIGSREAYDIIETSAAIQSARAAASAISISA